ncbi:tyrosinase precursor (monophenol monooxygenase) [Apiospora arundinis]|uniref:Tyrosinase (Monophenol monooxygenase) n=1 Tax=Apiospora arundinis TaxID=335852 RepID=A0ABR2HYA7_9PEZI
MFERYSLRLLLHLHRRTRRHSRNDVLVGVHHVFTAPAQVCDNCGDHAAAATVVSTTVPVTSILGDFRAQHVIPNLEPGDVKPLLSKRLKWRICKMSIVSPPSSWEDSCSVQKQEAHGRLFDPHVMAERVTAKVGISTNFIEDGQVSYSRYKEIVGSIVGSASATCNVVTALGDGLECTTRVFGPGEAGL